MGIIDRLNARKAMVAERNKERNKARLVKYKEERAAVKEQLETYKARNSLQKLKGEVRAQKLAPILTAVKGVQGLAKRAAANQQKNGFGGSQKDLFGTTKNADELLFGTKPKAPVKKHKRKKLRKVYYEYK